ncbi:hypothetical protein DID75_05950 [Candidatus Marinamargulisbacteria bacterium SCGC AG-410-N11]|nr:hypothetical protein DID75_05950 [Candidatus Marinamargulisbacteria bacterium SCGC AG-410-N11]
MSVVVDMDTLSSAIESFKSKVLAWRDSSESSQKEIIRHTIPIKDVAIGDWISCQTQNQKFYWKNRESTLEVAGIGYADLKILKSMSGLDHLVQQIKDNIALSKDSNIRYFGTISFDQGNRGSDIWAGVQFGQWILPILELSRSESDYFLTVQWVWMPGYSQKRITEQVMDVLNNVQCDVEASLAECSRPTCVSRTDMPDRDTWLSMFYRVMNELRGDKLKKIVLTRCLDLLLDQHINPYLLLNLLSQEDESSYRFSFELDNQRTFFGVSPERLYYREGNTIFSEAIAGTRPRYHSKLQDFQTQAELLISKKDGQEHDYVRKMIESKLSSLTTAGEWTSPSTVLELSTMYHLYDLYKGKIKESVTDADLIRELHPTPAVSGYPTDVALNLLESYENCSRGLFSGVVGWIGADSVDFVVAIRSALLKEKHLYVYSGVGLVSSSECEQEWQELELKVKQFLEQIDF